MPDYIGDNHLSQGCGRQRGNTDAAVIIIAVLIIVPGTSAAIAPLLSTRRNPRWFAVSGFVRVIPPCVLLFLFGGHFSFRRNETTTPTRIIQVISTLRLRLIVAGLKMTDYPCRIAILRYEKFLNYANAERNRAMRRKRTSGIPPDVRPLNPQSKLF